MTVHELVRMGNPVLRREADPYPTDKIGTDEFRQLVEDMRDTMHAAGGIGLAAPQIGLSLQVAVIEIAETGSRYGEIPAIPFDVYVNPTITVIDDSAKGYWEGCLSVPGLMGYVERPQYIVVDYLDADGERRSLEARGFLATVFQHEFDHLKGTLYVDRIKDPALFAFEGEYRRFHQDD